MKFFDLYLAGKAREDEIDDYISDWHNSGDEVTCQLHEYLGMTWEEYGNWVKNDDLVALKKLRLK